MKPAALLTRAHRDPAPQIILCGDLGFRMSRVHEICGAARRTLAVQVAARTQGPVIWIAPTYLSDRLGAQALHRFMDPVRLLFVAAPRRDDLLWAMEETLKDGGAPLVIADLDALPGMTPVRRLHLAAEAGTALGPSRPVGLLLTPGVGGAPGVETRWSCAPLFVEPGIVENGCEDGDRWRLDRLRARMLPPQAWHWDGRRAVPFSASQRPGQPLPQEPKHHDQRPHRQGHRHEAPQPRLA